MTYRTDDTRIRDIQELVAPAHVLGEFPISAHAAQTVQETRDAIHRVLHGADDRLVIKEVAFIEFEPRACRAIHKRRVERARTLSGAD